MGRESTRLSLHVIQPPGRRCQTSSEVPGFSAVGGEREDGVKHQGLALWLCLLSPSKFLPLGDPAPPGIGYQLRQRLFVRLNLLHIPGLLFNRKYAEADLFSRTGKITERFPRRVYSSV